MKSILILLVLSCNLCAQEYIGVYYPCYQTVQLQYYGGSCDGYSCPQQYYSYPQQYYYQSPPRRRAPEPAPDGVQTPPVGSPGTPEYQAVPSPPQPVNPPVAEQPKPPSVTPSDVESKLVPIQNKVDELSKKVADIDKQLNARIETVAQMQVLVNNDVKVLKEATPNYDAIAAEVTKRLPPINMRVAPQAPYQKVSLGSYVTLPLDKQPQTQ